MRARWRTRSTVKLFLSFTGVHQSIEAPFDKRRADWRQHGYSVSTTVFLAMKANAQVLDGLLDIVAELDLAIHADSAWQQRSGETTIACSILPSKIEAATPSRWPGSASAAIETNRWRAVFVESNSTWYLTRVVLSLQNYDFPLRSSNEPPLIGVVSRF